MRTNIDGRSVSVKYKHLRVMKREEVQILPIGIHWKETNNVPIPLSDEINTFKLSHKGGFTLCIVSDLETSKKHFGISVCRANEVYDKKIGCRQSFAYAKEAFQQNLDVMYNSVINNNPKIMEYITAIVDLY